jgi:putative restriction endonuclease
MQYYSDHLVEAQAAHIIPRRINGSDDPRNGIALSRTAHWAFDQGMFTISDQYEIIVHPKAKHAKINKFSILDLHGQPISKPEDDAFGRTKMQLNGIRQRYLTNLIHEVRKVIGTYLI